MQRNATESKGTYRHLSLSEREELAIGLSTGKQIVEIARAIGRDSSTLYREIIRNKPPFNIEPTVHSFVLMNQNSQS